MAGWSDFNGVSPLLSHDMSVCLMSPRLAGISVRVRAGSRAGEVHRLTQMRVSLTRPAAGPVSSPGCHRVSLSVHIAIVMRQKGVCKNKPFVMKHILHTLTLTLWFQWILAWKYRDCDRHYRKVFPSENRWDGNDGAPLSVSVMGFIRISQHIAHELEISVYYLQFTLFRLSLHLSVAVCAQSQQH